MNHEFKKIKSENETRYVLENASAGGTSSGSIASVSTAMGGVRRRNDNLLAQEADKKEAPKPRNFVAKNAKMGGAGQHKDKKKAEKHGDVKHKKPFAEQGVAEASFTAAASMNAANRKQSGGKTSQPTHGFRVGDQVTTKDGKEGQVTFVHGDTVHVKGTNNYYPDHVEHYSAKDLKQGVAEGGAKQLPTQGADYSKHSTAELKMMLRPGILHRNEARFKSLIRKELQKREQQGVSEGFFGIDDKIKGKIQNIVSRLSDEYGMWDHKAQTFTPEGLEHLESILKFNEKYIKYALSLTSRDYEAEGVAEDQLDELKKSTVKSYADKKQAELDDVPPYPFKKPARSNAEIGKDAKGMMGALSRLSGQKPTSESDGISKDKETEFHSKLDKLVHNTFGKRRGEMEGHNEPDHEISMASNELESIVSDAKRLLDLIKKYSEMEGLEAWQQSKITKAADYVASVLRSIGGEQNALEGLRDPKDNPCWKGYHPVGTKKKNGRTVPNCVPKEDVEEAAPKGWEGTVKAMKKHKDIDNPWALAHWMKGKGYKSHKKEDAYMENLSAKLAEKLDPNADPDVWVQDFQKADPQKYHQFKNKTPEKKAQMAIAARYAAKQPKSKR